MQEKLENVFHSPRLHTKNYQKFTWFKVNMLWLYWLKNEIVWTCLLHNSYIKTQKLTILGEKMMHLPLHPTLSKLVIWGAMFKCLDPILTIAATLEGNNDPFELVIEDEKRQNLQGIRSQKSFFQVNNSAILLQSCAKIWCLNFASSMDILCTALRFDSQSIYAQVV